MAQLGLTEMPDILCPEDNTESQWTLSAELPTEIGYKGTSITQQVKWRMVPPAENADIPAGPEEGGSRPNLSEVYYLDQPEDGNWYYLYRDEVSFNIDLRDAVYADQVKEEDLENLLRDHFTLSYDAGDGEQSLRFGRQKMLRKQQKEALTSQAGECWSRKLLPSKIFLNTHQMERSTNISLSSSSKEECTTNLRLL